MSVKKGSELAAVLATIDPISASSVQTSGWVSAKNFQKFLAIVDVGVLGASATVDAKIQQANTSGGGGAKDVSGTSITQLTKAGSDDNKQVLINLDPSALDIDNGFAWIRLSITPAVAACLITGVLLGLEPRYAPMTTLDATTVDEIVG